jgi:hypothetical protein
MPQVARLWPVWVALTIALTARPFAWHLAYFRSPGRVFLPAYLAALAVLAAGTVVYLRRRRPAWEPRMFAGFFLLFFLLNAPPATLFALAVLFVSFGLGRWLLGRVAESTLEQLTLWPAAGLGALSAVLFLLGLAGLYYRWLVIVLLGIAAAAFWRDAARLWSLWGRAQQAYAAAATSPLCGLAFVAVSVFSLASAMVVLSPEIAFDPVSFHFVYAREYAVRHRLEIVPRLPYSYFPQNVEIMYTLAFLIDGQIAAKVLTYAYFPLAALTLVLIGRRWFSTEAGLVGAALFATTPFIAWTGSVAKNDLALALYLLLALYAGLRWVEGRRFAWLAAAALFLGLGFGVKHVAVMGAVPLGLILAGHLRGSRLSLRQAAAAGAIFAACLFWHYRTWALAGHPLYPEFGGSAVESKTAAGHPELSRLDRLRLYAYVPWQIHFDGLAAFESPSANPVGFFTAAFLPLLFGRGALRNRPAKLLAVFVVLYFAYWAAILIKVRYAIAAFGVLYVWLADRMAAFPRRAGVLGMAGYCFAFALSLTLILEVNVPRLKLFARHIDGTQFLRESLITYRSLEALNRAARPGEFAYAVGNCSTFYADIEFHCYYDHTNRYSLERVARELRETHYNYLVVSNDWARPDHLAVARRYYEAELLHQDEAFRVYRLRRL